ncbi:hypothetical protein WDU94_008878 [Cyamophila willieti]
MAEKNRIQMTESATRINKRNSAYKVSRVSNMQVMDIVHTSGSKDLTKKNSKLIEINETHDPNTSENRFKDSIQNAIDDPNTTESRFKDSIQNAIDVLNTEITPNEELEEDSIVNDQVADVSKVVAQMNSNTFTEKVASICDQITIISSNKANESVKYQDNKGSLEKREKNIDEIEIKVEEYIGNGTGEIIIPQKRKKLLKFESDINDSKDNVEISNLSVKDKPRSISEVLDTLKNKSLEELMNKAEQNGSTNNLYIKPINSDQMNSRMDRLENNTVKYKPHQDTDQPLSSVQRIQYETSDNIPNETETESVIKDKSDDLLQKHIKDHREKSNGPKKKKSRRARSKSSKLSQNRNSKKKKKIIIKNNVINDFHVTNNDHTWTMRILVVNICVTVTLYLLLNCSISNMIDQKPKTQCVIYNDTMINQSHVNQLVNLQLKKQMKIANKLKYLMERYLKDNGDFLKHVNKSREKSKAKDNETEKPKVDTTQIQESREHLDAKLKQQKLHNEMNNEQPIEKGNSKNTKQMILFKHKEERKSIPINTY